MSRRPRPYQEEAVEAFYRAIRTHSSPMIVMATGLGKTFTAAEIIRRWPRGPVMFMAHTEELINQSADTIREHTGRRVVIEMGQLRARDEDLLQDDIVIVTSVQSMSTPGRLRKYSGFNIGLLIIDECHHATGSTYVRVQDHYRSLNPNLKILGLTATPRRADNTAMGLVFDHVAYNMDITRGMEASYLVPFVPLSATITGVDFERIGLKKNKFGEVDFNRNHLDAELSADKPSYGMVDATIRELPNTPLIFFTTRKLQAHKIAAIFNEYEPGSARAVDGETDKDERRRIAQGFKTGEYLRLVNCQVLTEGFDAPNAAAVVMGRWTKSESLYLQMLGRGLRPLPSAEIDRYETPEERLFAITNSAKPVCTVLDFVGVTQHGIVNCYDVLGGDYDVDIRQFASQLYQPKGQNGQAPKPLTKAEFELARRLKALDAALNAHEGIIGRAEYTITPAKVGAGIPSAPVGSRGTCSDKQAKMLISLGVRPTKALGCSAKQAGAMIDSLMNSRCADWQIRKLQRMGIDPSQHNYKTAKALLDEVKKGVST